MDAFESTSDFYEYLPVFRDFSHVADEACFTPMPDDWVVGVADVQQSTEAIRQNRYKAVNMAGAAVIASVANALKNRDFPFVFGGDGASFAVPSADARPRSPGDRRDRDLGQGRPRSQPPHRNGFGRRHSRARPRRSRRPIRSVGQHQHCDVLGWRSRLGRCRNETGRDRGIARPARLASRFVRAVLPL